LTFGIMSWSLVAAVILALALGGDFRHLSSVRFRGWWLLMLALALKFLLLTLHVETTAWAQPLIFALVAAGAVWNWRLPGVALIGFGLLLNTTVAAANGGVMPFFPAAMAAAGRPVANLAEQSSALSLPESVNTPLAILDDRIPFSPTRQVLSIGDVAIMVGGAWLIVAVSRPRRVSALMPATI